MEKYNMERPVQYWNGVSANLFDKTIKSGPNCYMINFLLSKQVKANVLWKNCCSRLHKKPKVGVEYLESLDCACFDIFIDKG